MSPLQKREQPDLPLWLHAFIRREIKKGATDASVIASEALKVSMKSAGNAKDPTELNSCYRLPSPTQRTKHGAKYPLRDACFSVIILACAAILAITYVR